MLFSILIEFFVSIPSCVKTMAWQRAHESARDKREKTILGVGRTATLVAVGLTDQIPSVVGRKDASASAAEATLLLGCSQPEDLGLAMGAMTTGSEHSLGLTVKTPNKVICYTYDT